MRSGGRRRGVRRAHRSGALALLLAALPLQAQNLIGNPGFEDGLNGWTTWGASLSQVAEPRHSGSYAGRVADRSEAWQGPVQSVLGVLTPGTAYRVSAWVRVGGESARDVGLTFVRTDDRGDVYEPVAQATAFPDRWVQISDVYHFAESHGAVMRLDFFVEGPAPGIDLFVDDVAIEALPADWKSAANERIDALRKRELRVRVRDASGDAVDGATVRFVQIARDFPIGTVIAFPAFDSQPKYRDYIVEHFNFATHENEAKWYHNEAQRDVVTYERADAILDFAEMNGIPMRGHTIFWAPERWQPSWVPGLDSAELEIEVEARLEDAVSHFRGRFLHWDVNNEMLHGDFFERRLGDGVRQWMFERTRELDPEVALFVNDYNIISGSETDAYVQQIQDFLDRGFPIDGIGVQGHFREVDPWAMQLRLDKLAPFGLPVWVTELDVELADEEARADSLEAALRVAYAHPAVEGIVLWGFWEGSHWKGPDAALVGLDWMPNAAGRRFEGLLQEWTSLQTRTANDDGVARARVFHGEYRIEIAVPGFADSVVAAEVPPGDGTETVDVTLGFDIGEIAMNAGHAGAWYNPQIPGQGLFLDVEPESRFLFASWFTYTGAGSDHPYQQRWFTAQGSYAGSGATLDLYETLGGRFDDPQEPTTKRVGELQLRFADCESGEAVYSIPGDGLKGAFPLERVVPGSAESCYRQSEPSVRSVDINAGMDGAWYDPDTAGQGFLLDARPDPEGGGFLFAAWFTFGEGTASGQRWLTAQGSFDGPVASLDLYETKGGSFDDPRPTTTQPAGTLSLDFESCNNAIFRYLLSDTGAEGEVTTTRVVPGSDALCMELAAPE
jgi:GH35 family endo-1,4-beta-xylanase